ncbi:Frataxin [Hypoxylon crocopeplum]|nr:Frataxin [Hypoxylon crocopeplum]
MTRANLARLGRWTATSLAAAARHAATYSSRRSMLSLPAHTIPRRTIPTRLFSTSMRLSNQESPRINAASITDAEYHELADEYLDTVLGKYEELQDESGDVDVEFSSGVMTVKVPNVGIYVINKQPPNKQIWLSSPVSGPKRYDYVIVGEGEGDKQDTAKGKWIYLRDGTTLNEVLQKETGIVLDGLAE